MAILTTGNSYSDGNQITSSNLNAIVNSATFSDPVDTSSGLNLTSDSPPKIAINTALSNKTLTGGSLNNCPIGAVTPSTGSFTTLTASGDVTFDTDTLKVDSTNNRVGIGTTSPSEKLEVAGNAILDATDANLKIKAGGAGTTGAVYYTFDTDSTIYGRVDLPYDTRASVGLRMKSAGSYPITIDSGNGILFAEDGTAHSAFDTAGNLGIGTVSPQGPLHVVDGTATGQTASGNGHGIVLDSTTDPMGMSFLAANTAKSGILFGDTDDADIGRIEYDHAGNNMNFITNTALQCVVDSAGDWDFQGNNLTTTGNVGIGGSPAHKLDVNSGATNQVALFESTDSTAYIELADDTGSVQLLTLSSGDFKIYTGGSGAGNLGTSKLVVEAGGNVGIGDDTPSYKLDVNGTGRFVNDLTLDEELIHNLSGAGALPGYNAGTFGAVLEDGGANGSTLYMSRKNSWALYLATDTTLNAQSDKVVQFADLNGQSGDQDNVTGSITITASATAFNTSSDYRLKENEVDITDGIDRLKELKPYRFNFTRDPSTTVDGFFAHEVSPVVPESINGEKDQVDDEGNPVYQGIDQSKLVPLLTAALQEAVAKIEALEARVQTLEG